MTNTNITNVIMPIWKFMMITRIIKIQFTVTIKKTVIFLVHIIIFL